LLLTPTNQVREVYKLNGEVSVNRRRDWRKGAGRPAACLQSPAAPSPACRDRPSPHPLSPHALRSRRPVPRPPPRAPGGCRGVASAAAPDRLQLRLEFDDPYGGVNVDEFSMPSPDEMHVKTVITSGGETAEFTQVYTRRR
jgi:hypothetical protein